MLDSVLTEVKSIQKEGFVYLATPYTISPRGLKQAYIDSCEAAGYLISKGLNIFCPIAHSHPISVYGGVDSRDIDLWMSLDTSFIESAKCLIVVRFPGWEKSKGIKIEIKEFKKRDKPIFFIDYEPSGISPSEF